MDDVLSEEVSIDELRKFEKVYNEQLERNTVTPSAQFEYAWCLVRSKYPTDIKKGILFLEELCKTNKDGIRDYLYYLAVGNARIKEYSKALKYVKSFLHIEPGNQQVANLEILIKKRMDSEGIKGIALASGLFLTIGAVAAVGISLASRKWSKHHRDG